MIILFLRGERIKDIDVDKLDFNYNRDAVIAGIGGLSAELAEKVIDVLKSTFRFEGLESLVNRDVSSIKPFLDSEARFRQKKADVMKYRGQHVFIVRQPKVFDNRLRDAIQQIRKRAGEMGIQDQYLLERITQLEYLGLPDMEKKVAARFTSSRFNPSAIKDQIIGMVRAAKMGGARHISVVVPKTSYEWSHHYAEKWNGDNVYEMDSWHVFLETLAHFGADSFIVLHPHAPKEGLDVCHRRGLNYVMMYPQTFTLNSNGWIYDIDRTFRWFNISGDEFDPINAKIKADREALGQYKDLSSMLMFSSALDDGAKFNAEKAAKRFGMQYVVSAKHRDGEGDSEIVSSERIDTYLLELMKHTKDAPILIYIFDDKINSGGSANKEARARKKQIEDFNREHGTNYMPRVEAILSHIRYHELPHMEHEHVDKINVFNTVPYLPSLREQADTLGIGQKFNIIENTPQMLSLAMALDYFVARFHRQFELNPMAGNYRYETDRFLVQQTKWGKDTKNMMRHYD